MQLRDRGDVTLEDGRANIVFRRLLGHSIERVWQAITDPKELSAWLLESATIEPREGGRMKYVSSPDPIVWYGTILVWQPPHIYEHEFNTDPDARWAEHLSAERTVARWELEARGDATLLTLSFRGFTPQTATGFAPGTHAFLERLARHLEGRPLPDWSELFQELRPLYWSE